jgi:hypothetical protein
MIEGEKKYILKNLAEDTLILIFFNFFASWSRINKDDNININIFNFFPRRLGRYGCPENSNKIL